ncbi:pyridoxal phosphate-dependent aminotransferase [Xanthovirga aplysinae]|uniref:pyridoxal phosphate-dependent aminotransferase n=1 Tax=Xanthovirga aplysinae TaxID=2529853 RepID=UPI0012BD0B7D|nr:histidinol-phosphate transaminase [Xanthovirga aplysinae]MTI30725.1 aminotransferase class I/II-fold pyridoxal phosphate-dependent enzyme [Xanthovirga aplysinae]
MKNNKLNRRKLLQLSGTLAAATAIIPSAYGSFLLEGSLVERTPKASGKMRSFSNENPYGPSQKVQDVILSQVQRINRYPTFHQYDTNSLKSTIARKYRIDKNQIILGHGSFEILCMLSRAFGERENSIIVPGLTFNVTGRFADKLFAHKSLQIPVTRKMDIDLSATRKAVTKATRLVYLCNPNNPTGKCLSVKEIEKFCREIATPSCTVAIDEAYIELVDPVYRPATIKLLQERYNVLIIRTFSKAYGLAGLRIGYAMGVPDTIAKLESEHFGFNGLLSNLGVAGAITALNNDTYVEEYRLKNKEVRGYVQEALKNFGIEFHPSSTNFIYLNVKDFKRYKAVLEGAGFQLAVGGWPNFPNWARISIGNLNEMKAYVEAITNMDWLVV